MNIRKVVVAGLVAGLVLNIGEGVLHAVVLAEQSEAAMRALGKDVFGSPAGMGLLVLVTFVQGLIGMALYGSMAVRNRGRAVAVGVAVWVLSGVYSAIYFYAGYPGVIPDSLVWTPVVWELVQYPLAMVAGAAVYGDSAQPRP